MRKARLILGDAYFKNPGSMIANRANREQMWAVLKVELIGIACALDIGYE